MSTQKSKETVAIVEESIDRFLANDFLINNTILKNAAEYAIRSGGKRFRPSLMIIIGQSMGISSYELEPYYIALELIHTYSLIHDDLPCMDNDDFRRGKPTVHKVFGEANAVLVGDLLLNLAHALLISKAKCNQAAALVSRAGLNMLSGQIDDINGIEKTKERVFEMYNNKTGALISAAIMVPVVMSKDNLNFVEIEYLTRLAHAIGVIFQLADDISDYNSGEDKDKTTIINVIGLSETKNILQSMLIETKDLIHNLKNLEELSIYLDEIIQGFLKRPN